MTICYFSATGNCLYVAKRIGGTLLSIPQLMKQNDIEITDDAVGIVAPVYAVEMPMMVKDFLSKAKIKTDYFFFVYTYGMGYAAAFAHVEQVCREKGLKLSYINAIQMVDNYLPGFEMQNQIDTLPKKNVEGQIKKLLSDIASRVETPVKITAADKAQMAMYQKMLAKLILCKDTAQGYIVTDNCTRCGICAKVCPADNITVTDKVRFANRCEVCYACLHNCPQNAIHMKNEKSEVRFRNENISLKDIIEANE
ncbi:EFR1 family ferrodoxin [Lachnoclostridium sp. MSJ-17]|uniref:EFR1 family ferrodoxin n=1 Tax=Lachnoclostridium sp. MSJ-17 TaxID=2841516 RepID=UPI001C11DFC5|nr:EFR1 family ferrodoxin [Lachnoclostridium sp. MSJ-17]MBU5462244.1 4Fe-4S dicluster domain-containing protein [Lachnoclostridium sp. MSJ-17]